MKHWQNRYSNVINNADGTYTTTTHIGPQVFWNGKEWQELNSEDHYATDGYYLIQNALITAKIYDWYSTFLDPDNKKVCVDDERWIVEVYNEKTKKWKELDLYNPKLSCSNNSVTRTFDCQEGLFEVGYILKQGARLKHNVKFTSRMGDFNKFRVTMKLAGIYSDKVRHSKGEETITGEKHILSPYFSVGDNFSEYLWSLGNTDEETREWTPNTLKDIILNTHAKGMKADIVIGDYNLAKGESLVIDPITDTFYVGGGYDDAKEWGHGAFSNSSSWVSIDGYYNPESNQYCCGGFRFPNVTIPKGMVIYSAKFSGWITGTDYDDPCLTIYGNAEDNALDFNDLQKIISTDDRPRTTANVPWVADGVGTQWQDKTGLEAIVQEIVDRDGWSSGNAIVLLFIAGSSIKHLEFNSYDAGSQYAAKLEVTWGPPSKTISSTARVRIQSLASLTSSAWITMKVIRPRETTLILSTGKTDLVCSTGKIRLEVE